jgi:GT2 family glycosyltransferase
VTEPLQQEKSVLIILLNWNGWGDTLECLESIFRLKGQRFQVMVCDNGSTDNSLGQVAAWARGELDAFVRRDCPLRSHSFPPVPKPIPHRLYAREQVEDEADLVDLSVPLHLVENRENLGFAAGNNVALRFALKRKAFSHVWLLNNDTVVSEDALAELVQKAANDPDLGIVGSTCPYYDAPDRVWAFGGATYNIWTSLGACIGHGTYLACMPSEADVEARMKYVAGASMLVSLRFLSEVGFMCEEYFLYFEEPDWAWRARGRYSLGFASRSIVFHKVGASTVRLHTPWRMRWLVIRNRFLFTWKFRKIAIPSVFVVTAIESVGAVLRKLIAYLSHVRISLRPH